MTDPMIVFFGGFGIMPYTFYDVKSFFATLNFRKICHLTH